MTHLRVGLIGAGGISGVHVDGWERLGAELIVYATAGAEAIAARTGARIAASADELIGAVDIVDIVTPSGSHRDYAVAAMDAGVAVVCEKPLARTLDDAVAVARAERRSGGRLFPAHVVRYFPEYAAAKAAVDAGRTGDLAVLRFSRAGAAPAPGAWFFDEEASGGLIMDQMVHDLDQARWIAGEVTEVYAVQNPSPRPGERPERVTAHVVLTHLSGAISFVQGSWEDAAATFRTSFSIAGRDGVLEHDSLAARTVLADASGGYLPPSVGESPYARELADFAAAVASGADARVTAADGVIAVALAEAARSSVRERRPVTFDEDAVLGLIDAPDPARAVGEGAGR